MGFLHATKAPIGSPSTDRVEGNIIWIDDDAVVINRFDEVFGSEFDIGVTLRSKYDERKQEISPLNAGVLFFNTSSEKKSERSLLPG